MNHENASKLLQKAQAIKNDVERMNNLFMRLVAFKRTMISSTKSKYPCKIEGVDDGLRIANIHLSDMETVEGITQKIKIVDRLIAEKSKECDRILDNCMHYIAIV